MPAIYYTEEEHKNIVRELQRQGLALAQQVCRLTGTDCIVGVGGSSIGGHQRGYCHDCPAEHSCPWPNKQWPK